MKPTCKDEQFKKNAWSDSYELDLVSASDSSSIESAIRTLQGPADANSKKLTSPNTSSIAGTPRSLSYHEQRQSIKPKLGVCPHTRTVLNASIQVDSVSDECYPILVGSGDPTVKLTNIERAIDEISAEEAALHAEACALQEKAKEETARILEAIREQEKIELQHLRRRREQLERTRLELCSETGHSDLMLRGVETPEFIYPNLSFTTQKKLSKLFTDSQVPFSEASRMSIIELNDLIESSGIFAPQERDEVLIFFEYQRTS